MHAHTRVAVFVLALAAVAAGNAASAKTIKDAASTLVGTAASSPLPATIQQPDLRGTKASPLVIETVESLDDMREKREVAKFRELDSSTSRWMMLLAVGGLAVAAVQAWFFVTQLELMKRSMKVAESTALAAERSVETMQDTARRQLRPYLSIDRAWIEFPEPGVPSVTLVIKNTGQTPAHDLRQWIHQWIAPYPLNIELPVPPEGFVMSSSPLGAGAIHNMRIKAERPIINPLYLDEIGTPESTIYVYGEITYKDVFGDQQFFKYRLMYGGPEEPGPGILSPCEEGNEAS